MPQQACTIEKQIIKTIRLNYLLYLPPGYGDDPRKKWPLILHLHGAGERGDDLSLVKKHGLFKLVEQGRDFPFIAIAPQCPMDTWWDDYNEVLIALLDEIAARYGVDTDRVYLTGLSMGGYGTWLLAAAYPQRFAAIAPICGGGMPFRGFPAKVCVLKDVPVWAFHGAKDPVVPPSESEMLVNTLQASGGKVRFTVYPEAEHDSWTRTYENPALYDWFLQYTRGTE